MITSEIILQRMVDGDLPVVSSSFSFQSQFSDGTVVPHQTMQSLVAAQQIAIAGPGGRGCTWIVQQSAVSARNENNVTNAAQVTKEIRRCHNLQK